MDYRTKCFLANLIVSLNRAKTVEQKGVIKAQIKKLNPNPQDYEDILDFVL